ncbi:hypothetical protein RND71_035630 [Anisodus tanguticus]|uniref:HECT-type E3 ubiquitin transferase n=1 Tax=Anisodus tanguticus TaxID=243964 RepID=A0AAE1R680_9SOLA|nr:hypothetical protein RND71_035630 [Anisodus tanguticus]
METRSRKRTEATSSAPSSSSSGPTTRAIKRARLTSRATSTRMDSTNESSGSGTRTRRVKNNNNPEKGKEKEPEIRDVDRDMGDDEDDNESEGNVGILHQNLTSASSALQGLLRKLGAGLDDLLPSSAMVSTLSLSQQNGRFKRILSGLRADGEEGKQIEALTQLCVMLSIGTEDSLNTFSVDSYLPVLVGLLNHRSNPDIMLLAARALTHLVDVLPSSCAAVVHYGAVSCFVARLLTIEYMDLAEQSLQALKKISQEDPTACLRAGALMAVLSYLDFFSTGVQRVALATAANMCKKLPSDAADFVMEAVPLLTNLLQYHDAKVLEHASICLTRIAEALASSPEKLDELCNHGLVTQAASLISTSNSGGGQASLSTETYTGLIRLLSTCASGSPLVVKTLMILGISGILKDILSGSGLVASVSISPGLSRPAEQIFEIVNLANELLPLLPQGIISLPVSTNLFTRGSFTGKSSASGSSKQEDLNASSQEVSAREKLLNDQPELLQQFGTDLLPVLIQTYGSSVNTAARRKCLSVIGKLMYFSNANMIQSLINVTNISSFLAGVLAWKDPQVLVPALQIAEILMEKLPGVFGKMFFREGVVHAVDALMLSESHVSAPPQPSRAEEKRNRRRSANSNTDATSVEDPRSPVPSTGSPPDSMEILSVNSSLRMAVSTCAKAFKDKYFPSDSEAAEASVTDDLIRLKNLCMKLNAGIDEQIAKPKGKSKTFGPQLGDSSVGKEENLAEVILAMMGELSKVGVSTFEFIGSEVVASLLKYFTFAYLSKERISNTSFSKLRQQAIRRYKSFIAVALPTGVDGGSMVPMTVLVQKLQNALCSLERFPVVLSQSSRSSTGNASLSSGLSVLSQPFKLRLCRAQGEKSLRDYSSNVLLIDPLASLLAIEEFLWARVERPEAGQKVSASAANSGSGTIPAGGSASSPSMSTPPSASCLHSARSRSAVNDSDGSSSKGKGKAVLKPAQKVDTGSRSRNPARIRAALEKALREETSDNRDSSSEDDELDRSLVELDDALVIEDDMSDEDEDDHDDVLRDDPRPICMADEVHDVKLGDSLEDSPLAQTPTDGNTDAGGGSRSRTVSARGSDSIEFRSRNSYGSRGAMSFAAAAMVGLSSASGRGMRGVRDRHGHRLFGSGDPPKLIFSVGGKPLNRNLTIYQAIQRQLVLDEDDDERYGGSDFVSSDGSRVWSDIYTITYQRADNQAERSMNGAGSSIFKSTKTSSLTGSSAEPSLLRVSLLDSILQGELPCDLEKSNPTYSILYLLRVLEALNQLAPGLRVLSMIDDFSEGKISSLDELSTMGIKIPSEEFVNSKLTPKLARQIQDALALCSGSLPSWCYQLTKACPFLFPFETRRQYFYSTAFGLSRALYRLQQQQGAGGNGSTHERAVRVGRLQRQKVRVSRNHILDSAAKVMEMYSSQKAVLEVEYFGEVGTGLGPTLEFYTLLSHDLQKVGLGMWRSGSMEVHTDNKLSGGDKDLVQAPLGLFPRPWSPHTGTVDGGQFYKTIEYFRLLGRVMAKALQDGRLLDLPLSTAFYKLVLGQELDLYDIISFDAELGKTLQELQALVSRKQYIESMENQNLDKSYDMHFRGTLVEDLCLDFTLPGYPEYVLKAGDENVDLSNLEEYISLVVDATVKTGIRQQMEAFRSGFNQVFDYSTLQIFSHSELDHLLCGRRELWKPETLVDHIKFDHGYTSKSPTIIHLLEIMGEFTPEQQRAFCQFVTGAPRLPAGGLAALNPKLTIVRKHSSSAAHNSNAPSESADEDLPSVMTCANYLKLPPYSSKEIMYKKLLYAINEGRGSFDLS